MPLIETDEPGVYLIVAPGSLEEAASLAQVALERLGAVRVELLGEPLIARRLEMSRLGAVCAGDRWVDRWGTRSAAAARRLAGSRATGELPPAHRPLDDWEPLCGALGEHYPVRELDAERIVVTFADVEVTVALAEACGRPWLRVGAPVCERHALDPVDALVVNGTLACGALAVHGEALVLEDALPLAEVPRWRVRLAVELIATEARRLAAAVAEAPEATVALQNYAE